MNLSGDCVQPAAAFLEVSVGDILVVHDELDLPFGEVRIKVGGGHAGHNGLRSIIQRLGTPDFVRVRVGIGQAPPAGVGDVADWVLSRFDAAERAELPGVVSRAADAVSRVAETDGAGDEHATRPLTAVSHEGRSQVALGVLRRPPPCSWAAVPRARVPSGTSPGGLTSECDAHRPSPARLIASAGRARTKEYETIYILRSDVDADTAEKVQTRVPRPSSASTASS